MSNDKLRRRVAREAAGLLFRRQETDFFRARVEAARRLTGGLVDPRDLPTDREVRDELRARERLAGVDPQAASASADLDDGLAPAGVSRAADPFHVFRMLLAPLEQVQGRAGTHPEGDVLYHSLQVFDLAREELPYDEEFLLAALLHDVGKAIDPYDHVAASLAALAGYATPRTLWFIEQHIQAQALFEGTLGARARRRLEASSDYDDLLCLAECDRAGRVPGAQVCDVDQALAFLEELEQTFC